MGRQLAVSLTVTTPAQPDPALASTLRSLRLERGQTQEDLAHHAGITTAALARIERGQANPTWITVRCIADALDVSLAKLGASVEAAGS
jgi:transcriptional regulator with XRE-family HTH domain